MMNRRTNAAQRVQFRTVLLLLLAPAAVLGFSMGLRRTVPETSGTIDVAAFNPNDTPTVQRRRSLSILQAVNSQGGYPRMSKTAHESAVIVEWEPVSELQRRVDEGVNYEHWPEESYSNGAQPGTGRTRRPGRRSKTSAAKAPWAGTGGMSSARGVFCGYRTTSEERERLRSADPDMVSDDYSI